MSSESKPIQGKSKALPHILAEGELHAVTVALPALWDQHSTGERKSLALTDGRRSSPRIAETANLGRKPRPRGGRHTDQARAKMVEAAAQRRFERELGRAIITLIGKYPDLVIKKNADGVSIKPNGDS
jgi:hypothetical protein